MKRLLTLFAILSVILLAPLAQLGAVAAQDDARDLREATFTAQEILSLASQRKFNAMYDRIHPDAHAIIPRAAAVGTFEALYGKYQVGEATIGEAKIIAWTWGVTGKTYDHTVQVAFTQPFTDEQGQTQTLSDVINLVKADGGEWRWFFGSSKQMVEDAIAKYGPPPDATPLVEGDLIGHVLQDLDAFYADVVSYTQFAYVSPHFEYVAPGTEMPTACGPASTGFWAFYCPGDQTIYVEQARMDDMAAKEDFGAAFVLAHEFSHHVQTLVGFKRVQSLPTTWNQVWSVELELMADCMSGAWALDADTRGRLQVNDFGEALKLTIDMLGDPSYVGTYDPRAHGTADQRAQAFQTGFEDGFLGCNIVM